MTPGKNRGTILRVAFTLLIFFFLGVGATDSCRELENIAVFEGERDTFIPYPANPNGAKWTNSPTTDELDAVVIVKNNGPVDPYCKDDYAYNSSAGLTIKNATTKGKPDHPLATAGLYTVECDGNRFGFKFLVVRRDPPCLCKVSSSTIQVTCNTIYADSIYDPIAAIFTLFVNGHYNTFQMPQRSKKDEYTWISTTTFTTDYHKSWTYLCIQTFDQPTEVQDPSVAMNAPKFVHHVCSC